MINGGETGGRGDNVLQPPPRGVCGETETDNSEQEEKGVRGRRTKPGRSPTDSGNDDHE